MSGCVAMDELGRCGGVGVGACYLLHGAARSETKGERTEVGQVKGEMVSKTACKLEGATPVPNKEATIKPAPYVAKKSTGF